MIDHLKKHVFATEDEVLIILKWHLIVEEGLNRYLDINLKSSKYLDQARFSFHQKLCLVRSLNDSSEVDDMIWDQYVKLNSIRNKIAHNLEPNNIKELIKQFNESVVRPYTEDEYDEANLSDIEKLRTSIACLCGQLSGLIKSGA